MDIDIISRRVAQAAVLLLPIFLFYARAIADGIVVVVALLFIVHSARRGGWQWLRRPWVAVAAAFWAWQMLASFHAGPLHSAVEAVLLVRFPLFVAALEGWLLTSPRSRQALWAMFAVLAVWMGIECWEQYFTGRNLMGYPRWPDGALTGPFIKPRAGEIFLFVALPGLLPVVLRQISGAQRKNWFAGILLLLLTLATMIFIGQRMPNLLFLLGICITGLLVKNFRWPLLIAIGAGVVALALLPVISPPTFAKLVLKFVHQMSNFAASPYGQLYTRASVMIAAHPLAGFGFEGFRDFCGGQNYFHGWPGVGIPDADNGGLKGCNIHPHNYYMQAGTMAGIPGILLFLALGVLWLRRMAAALQPRLDPGQAMLFVTACVIFWPLASTSSLFTIDTAGWVFLICGWGLAASADKAV
jgi:O-antigen ligase